MLRNSKVTALTELVFSGEITQKNHHFAKLVNLETSCEFNGDGMVTQI